MKNERNFPGKVLLFGEYTVLHGSQALAIPFHGRNGKWVKGTITESYNKDFSRYLEWLSDRHNEQSVVRLDIAQMKTDFENSLIYQSNIPNGYGLGSSGALSAAILSRYGLNDLSQATLPEIRAMLSELESFFHGKSSGIDPLVSYTQSAIWRKRDNTYHLIKPTDFPGDYKVWLIDSGIPRSTEEWVAVYRKKIEDHNYLMQIQQILIPHVEHCIQFIIQDMTEHTWPHIQMISEFQLEHFREMIPEPISDIWSRTSSLPNYSMKLCGAGGGGYFLLFTRGIDQLPTWITDRTNSIGLDIH